jgi:hypothetical protein
VTIAESVLGETEFTSQINTMVADESPRIFALVEEIKDRVERRHYCVGHGFS